MGPGWEKIDEYLYRRGVPGGWLYGYTYPNGASITFVPRPYEDQVLYEVVGRDLEA